MMIWVLMAAMVCLHSEPGYSATSVSCSMPGVTVLNGVPEEGELACEAVSNAVEFMYRHGFRVDTRFSIEVVDRPLNLHGTEVTGTYDSRKFHIQVPSLSQAKLMAQRHQPFQMSMCRTMWQSFVAHEVAHAVAQANFQLRKPSLVAHEYIAYVVQFATLPDVLRQRLLAGFDNPAFQHERQITRIFLELDPEIFAVKAYRHFIAQPDPESFFHRLLNKKLSSPH